MSDDDLSDEPCPDLPVYPDLPPLPPEVAIFQRKHYEQWWRDQIPKEKPTCPLAHPTYYAHRTHVLIGRHGGNTKSPCFSCGQQKPFNEKSQFYYRCKTCHVDFHDGCHKFPKKVTHPSHIQHPLTFTIRDFETGIVSDGNIDESFYDSVLSEISDASDPNKSRPIDIIVDKCTWCQKYIESKWFYRCSLCNFLLDLSCYQNIPLLTISNPKSHHHSLVLYPRPLLTPCDACGFVNGSEPSYACFQCNYMVHKSCIDLPRVIKITRHRHRLSHALYLQPITSPCRVCYKTVDGKYGQYSCDHEDCSYVVHSKCATHKNVWDGKELEWEPEESEEIDYMSAPFKRLGHDTIKHFSHRHPLKLDKYDGVRDEEKQCQACILPINSRDFYNCMQCDFSLHEVCAGLLRKLDHALHVHTLVLVT